MTIDKFLKIFPKCPVCRKGRITYNNTDVPSFSCEQRQCFVIIPGESNITYVGAVILYENGYIYEYIDRELRIYLEDGKEDNEALGNVFCAEEMMIFLFSNPSNIHKILLVS